MKSFVNSSRMTAYKLCAVALFLSIFPISLRAADANEVNNEVNKEAAYIVSCDKLDADMEGKTVYMMLYDTNQRVDSAKVKDGKFILKGTIPESSYARLDLDRRYANFIAGEGEVVVDFETHLPVTGNKVNMLYKQIENELIESDKEQSVKADSLRKLDIPQEEKFALLKETFTPYFDSLRKMFIERIRENNHNGAGHALTLICYNACCFENPEKWNEVYSELSDWLKSHKQIQKIDNSMKAILKTSEGSMFADLNGETVDGLPAKLSDYVGKGKYVLVDFWASWCGPCIAEAKSTLMPLHEKYKDSENFMILGAATWDGKDATLKAIDKHGFGWQHIVKLGQAPMQEYGFSGIPMIILFGPDGQILKRDLRGERLVMEVEKVAQLPKK